MAITLCDNTVVSSTLRHGRQAVHSISAPALLFSRKSRARIGSAPQIAPVLAKLVRFTGRKEVSIPFRERALPPGEYLKETARIVNVTFPDSTRIKYLGDSVWQARLMTITFFNLSATPSTDVRVEHDDGALILDSTKLYLDVAGLSEQFRNTDLQLNLHGELRVSPRRSEQSVWDFGGFVNLGLAVDLPLPLSLIPEELLTGVGDQVVARILGAMEGALLQGIIDDYNAWCALAPAVPSAQQF